MAASRQERFLMRQRGAGARELKDDDFGFALPGLASLTGSASAGTAAQRARRTPRSGSSASSRPSRRLGPLRTSAQHTTTQVDENGSVIKKRRTTPTTNKLVTPAPGAEGGSAASGALKGSQKPSTGKRKKRKSIGQGSLFKKRSSANSRPSTSARWEEEEGAEEEDVADASVQAEATAENGEGSAARVEAIPDGKPAISRTLSVEKERAGAPEEPQRRRRKARKSTGRPASRPTTIPVKPKAAPPPHPTSAAEADQSPAPADIEDFEGLLDDGLEATQDAEPSAEPEAGTPVSIDQRPKIKRKGRRKSVNPIQQQRKKYRLSLESAQSADTAQTGPSDIRPAARKLALSKPILTAATQPVSKSGTGKPYKASGRTTAKPAASRMAIDRRRESPVPEPNADGTKAKPGSVPITVFRLRATPRLSSIAEEDENSEVAMPSIPAHNGPNAIDALAQVCGDLIQNKVQNAIKAEGEATGRTERASAKRKRTAIEAFGRELQSRFLDMTQALNHHASVQTRLRQAKKTRKSLRKELLDSREEEDKLAGDTYQLRSRRDLAAKIAEEDKQIVLLYKKLGRAVRDARNAQQDDDDLTPEGLEFELRDVERFSTAGGRQGLLGAIRVFNAQLAKV